MLKKDTAWFGFLFGLIVPLFGLLFFHELNELLIKYVFKSGSGFTLKFILILAVCANLLPFTVARRQCLDHQMQGIVGATMLYSMCVFVYMIYFL